MGLNELQSIMRDNKIDLTVLYNTHSLIFDPNILYFSGYTGVGALVIPANFKPFLVVPRMEYERASKYKLKVYLWEKKERLFETVKKILNKKKIKAKIIGIDKTVFTLDVYKIFKKYFNKCRTKDISLKISDLRKIKTKKEIEVIKRACNITDKILSECYKKLRNKKFKTESDIAAFIEFKANKYGQAAFPPIIASGKNSAQPHYTPMNIKIKKGFCIIDFGIRYKGYNTDISRTIYFGRPSTKEVELYNFLLKSQIKAINNIKINDSGHKIYTRTVKGFGSYAKYFTHGLGHGIGVKVHELPNLTKGSKDKFIDNMVFTVEPGLYILNKMGIRIEDDVLLTRKGSVVLTRAPKKLMIFEL